jgi:hypothetical protein
MNDDIVGWLSELERDLRQKIDRSDSLDVLFRLSSTNDSDILEKISWCLAKMAQNKVQDRRIYDFLLSMYDEPYDAVWENIAWGLGEMAGIGIGSYDALDVLKTMLNSEISTLRSTAAWAVGRYQHRLQLTDAESKEMLQSMLEDSSLLVRESARFAINDE